LQAVENRVRLSKRVLGVSLAANVLWDREQLHQSMLVGKAIPSSVQYQDTLHQVTNYFVAQGSSLIPGASAGYSMDRRAGADARRHPSSPIWMCFGC